VSNTPASDEPALGVLALAPSAPELVLKHLPLVRTLAAKLYRLRWDNSVAFDDYFQMGAVGLMEASQRFDPTRGVQFGTFASWRITGAILNGLEQTTELHQQLAVRRKMNKERIDSLRRHAAQAPGSPAKQTPKAQPDDAVAAALARISQLAIGLAVGFMLEDSGMFSAGHESAPQDGYAMLATQQLRQRLVHEVQALPEREREVIRSHYFQQQAFTEIAQRLALTKGRVSQLHSQAIARLRQSLHSEMIGFDT
jgi:RNA polymerase sigma factor FliA